MSHPRAAHLLQIRGYPLILAAVPAGIAAAHILPQEKQPLLRPEGRPGVDRVIILRPQQMLIIGHRKQCGREKDGGPPLIQTGADVLCSLHAVELQIEVSILPQFAVDHIIFIQQIRRIQEITQSKPEFQHLCVQLRLQPLLTQAVQLRGQGQRKQNQRIDVLMKLPGLALPLQTQQILIAAIQQTFSLFIPAL